MAHPARAYAMNEKDAKELRRRAKPRETADAILTAFVLQLLEQGEKPAAIAKELGWSRQRMHSWLRSRRA